jgi:hypothetical protein
MTRPSGVPVRASLRSERPSACALPMPGSRRFTIAGPGRARATSGTAVVVVVVGCITTSASAWGDRTHAVPSARSVRRFREGEPRFASVAVPWPRRASSLGGPRDPAAIDGICGLSRTDGRIAPTEVSCPRRMMVILQLRTVRPGQLPRRRVTPSDRHAARAIAMIGAVIASSCQVSPRSELRSSRPSAMPQTSSPARAATAYGIDSPGTGSSRQASPSQR